MLILLMPFFQTLVSTFGNKPDSSCYNVTQIDAPGFYLPFLACSIDDIDVKLIDWKNPNRKSEEDLHRSYDDQNLIFDVPFDGMKRSRDEDITVSRQIPPAARLRPVFSIVKHYPPEWAKK